MKQVVGGVVACVLALGVVSASAQSLADVARQEQERRKAIKKPSRVYTEADINKNLPLTTAVARPGPADGEGAGAAATDQAAPADGQQPASGNGPEGAAAPAAPAGEEAWRARVQEAREGLARSRRLLQALEQQEMRAAIESAHAAAAGQTPAADQGAAERTREMERLRGDVDKYTAQLAQIEEEARRAGIPPGWIR